MMRVNASFLFLLAALKVENASSDSVCGSPNDICMNENNFQQCRELEEHGCQKIAVLESCPLQFACHDEGTEEEDDEASSLSSQACATLVKYGNENCQGSSVAKITFTTQTAPGSPCYHDDTMYGYSVKDQYCDLQAGTFRQHVYGGNDCNDPTSRQLQVYSKDECTYGFKLGSCKVGPCPDDETTTKEEEEEETSL